MAGLVLKHFCLWQKSWRRRNLFPPSILIQMGPPQDLSCGEGPPRQGFRGPAEALLRLIEAKLPRPTAGGVFCGGGPRPQAFLPLAKILAQAEFTSAWNFNRDRVPLYVLLRIQKSGCTSLSYAKTAAELLFRGGFVLLMGFDWAYRTGACSSSEAGDSSSITPVSSSSSSVSVSPAISASPSSSRASATMAPDF